MEKLNLLAFTAEPLHHCRKPNLRQTYAEFINMIKKVVCKIHTSGMGCRWCCEALLLPVAAGCGPRDSRRDCAHAHAHAHLWLWRGMCGPWPLHLEREVPPELKRHALSLPCVPESSKRLYTSAPSGHRLCSQQKQRDESVSSFWGARLMGQGHVVLIG